MIGALLVICVVLIFNFCDSYKHSWVSMVAFLVFIATCVGSCNQSDWWNNYNDKANAESQRIAILEATPRVIREADGCKVFTFKDSGAWHYFTRCPTITTTETTHTYECGTPKAHKTCTKQETIPTQNK